MMNSPSCARPVNEITGIVIGCAFRVHNTLGVGFLEKVYENALAHEIRKSGLLVEQQVEIQVRYEEIPVGWFAAPLLIESTVLVEVKVVRALDDVHTAQCINYLRATGLPICLLINFAPPKLDVKRIVF
jgi:GxxExxY protein